MLIIFQVRLNNELHKLTGNGVELAEFAPSSESTLTVQEQGYIKMVSTFDYYVGEVAKLLKELGIDRRTLVIVTSDNGPTGIRTAASLEKLNATAGLKGMKGMVFEGGIRVPTVVWGWENLSRGHVEQAPTTFWDMLPTFAELARYDDEVVTDGISLVPLLNGNGDKNPSLFENRSMYWELNGQVAYREGHWKWIFHPANGGKEFLYNLESDPAESRNLVSRNPEIAARLKHAAKETAK